MQLRARHTALVGVALVAVASLALIASRWFGREMTSTGTVIDTPTTPSGESAVEVSKDRDPVSDNQLAPDAPVAKSWMARYRESEDRFAFAEAAAQAAVAGDVRAQYALSQVLLECRVEVGLGSLAENIEARMMPGYSESDRQRVRRQVQRCERFFDGNPLASFSLPPEAQSNKYWFDVAVAGGDPLAVMDRTMKAVMQVDPSDGVEAQRALGDTVLDDVRVAVSSREPAALAKVGWVYSM